MQQTCSYNGLLCRYLSRNTFIGTPHYIAPGEESIRAYVHPCVWHQGPQELMHESLGPMPASQRLAGRSPLKASVCCAEVMHVEVEG